MTGSRRTSFRLDISKKVVTAVANSNDPDRVPHDSRAVAAWSAAYSQLKLQLDEPTFKTWVQDATLVRVEPPNRFVIGVANELARDMMQHRLARSIAKLLGDLYREPVDLEFVVRKPHAAETTPDTTMPLFALLAQEELASQAKAAATASGGSARRGDYNLASPARPDLPVSELNPRYTLDRFVTGNENQLAYVAARTVAEHPAAAYNPLYIHGGVGVGKTHLLQAIAHACRAQGRRAIYISSEVFTNDLVDAIRNRTTALFRERYRTADVLLVDDIQFFSGKEATQEEFFHTFNALMTFNKQVVIASDRPPRELALLEDRLKSRFECGLLVDVQPPELETRIAILQQWAAERGVLVPHEVIERIAQRSASNVRELEGAFNKMVATSQFVGGAVTQDLADDVLDTFHRPRYQITVEGVIAATARQYGLAPADLIGPARTNRVSEARQVAMYIARELTTVSLPQLGEAFGGRKHSTVIYACRAVEEALPYDDRLATILDDLRRQLTLAR
jgi:chromosomal replication initiator protein